MIIVVLICFTPAAICFINLIRTITKVHHEERELADPLLQEAYQELEAFLR